jgi:hypothetical protein
MLPESLFGRNEFCIFIHTLQLILPPWISGIGGYMVVKLTGFLRQPFGKELSLKRMSTWFAGLPIGCASATNLRHWFQMLKQGGCITRYDGEEYAIEEMLHGWENHPDENFYRPNMLIVLGDNDCVVDHSTTKDVFSRCYTTNKKAGVCEIVVESSFGHIDFLWSGPSCTKKMYDKVLSFMVGEKTHVGEYVK